MVKERLVVPLEVRVETFRGIGALNLEGLVAAMTVPVRFNTEVFLRYVTQVLAPQLWKGAIVVMDNRVCSSCPACKNCNRVRRCTRQVFTPLLA